MRLFSSPLRALTIAGGIALLSLLSVRTAAAAPRRASGPICDPQTPVARKLPRHPRAYGGPLKRPSSHALAGLQDITARMRRGNRAYMGEEIAAIQNDTPATPADADDRLIPSLQPLEIIGSLTVQPRSRAFSPRSPRGPPALA
ncbi:MAG: hypothetical protein JWL71_2501 [Acidobacteria bacterium]|nr:hypothetical protein [Acidobacteriota bacterium]